MGNTVSNSKDRHVDEIVDFGYICPQGVYTGPQDWNLEIVTNLIVDRKLAPFYRPLEEYSESWDDEQILAARKTLPESHPSAHAESAPSSSNGGGGSKFHHKQSSKSGKDVFRPSEASVYRGAVECPICFLYYPPNINRSRCCDQSICTECFVQIKRAEPTTTHLVSEPACCPYCVQDNFGVTYEPPSWRVGLSRDGHSYTPSRPDMHKTTSGSSTDSDGTRRRKSFGADSPEVVTIDQIRPDWEAKLASVRAAVARRANRRIIMRQVGDRLIPIGVTSGRVVATEGAEGAEAGEGSVRVRRRRHQQNGQDLNQLLGTVGIGPLGGPDLEELMVMEAMRLSLIEHEEQQRRQAAAAAGNNNNNGENMGALNGNAAFADNSRTPSPAPANTHPTSSSSHGTSLLATPSFAPGSSANQRSPSPLSFTRLHRPGAPSPSQIAALSAARTASVFLNPRGLEGDEHVTPRGSRAPSPDPVVMAPAEPNQPGATPRRSSSVDLTEGPRVESREPGSSEAATSRPTPDSLTIEPSDTSPGVEGTQATEEGYKPLPSSTELSDPLLSWDESDAQQGGSESNPSNEHEVENVSEVANAAATAENVPEENANANEDVPEENASKRKVEQSIASLAEGNSRAA